MLSALLAGWVHQEPNGGTFFWTNQPGCCSARDGYAVLLHTFNTFAAVTILFAWAITYEERKNFCQVNISYIAEASEV